MKIKLRWLMTSESVLNSFVLRLLKHYLPNNSFGALSMALKYWPWVWPWILLIPVRINRLWLFKTIISLLKHSWIIDVTALLTNARNIQAFIVELVRSEYSPKWKLPRSDSSRDADPTNLVWYCAQPYVRDSKCPSTLPKRLTIVWSFNAIR